MHRAEFKLEHWPQKYIYCMYLPIHMYKAIMDTLLDIHISTEISTLPRYFSSAIFDPFNVHKFTAETTYPSN
jgi:hypothetical protein